MRSVFRVEYNFAFILRMNDIQRICDQLVSHIGPTEISIDCTDGISRKLASIDELAKFPNIKSKEMKNFTWRRGRAIFQNLPKLISQTHGLNV
jgi:hypothetical protein